MDKTEEFYFKFKERLEDTTEFPSDFTYKFIIPTSHKKVAEIKRVFDGANPRFQMIESKNGKYTAPFAADWLWRPLLDVPSAALRAHARAHGLRWNQDPANDDDVHDRNFLRHRVLPLLRERWPGAD